MLANEGMDWNDFLTLVILAYFFASFALSKSGFDWHIVYIYTLWKFKIRGETLI
jgi:hypothetical protein